MKSPAVALTAILNGMDEQPEIQQTEIQQTERRQAKRRWFRFRLSTVLILIAIAAWGMACWPFYYVEFLPVHKPGPVGEWFVPVRVLQTKRVPAHLSLLRSLMGNTRLIRPSWQYSPEYWDNDYQVTGPQLNRDLLWPTFALVAFLAWKAAWAVVEHRRHQSASPE